MFYSQGAAGEGRGGDFKTILSSFQNCCKYAPFLLQKQSFVDAPQNRFSSKLRNFHRKAPVLESLFNKATSLQACNFIKKRLQLRCFPVTFAKFLRTLFLLNTSSDCFCNVLQLTQTLDVFAFFTIAKMSKLRR